MCEEELDPEEYEPVGWFHVTELERLISGLQETGVRFALEGPATTSVHLEPITASLGGGFGAGAGLDVFVHPQDGEAFRKAMEESLIEHRPPFDWRMRLRIGAQDID